MTSAELIEIKALIKAELLRRNGRGSVASFASSTYDFTNIPKKGENIYPEHGQKTIDLLLKICDYKDFREVKAGDPIPTAFNYNDMKALLDRLKAEARTGKSSVTIAAGVETGVPEASSCRGNCTGLCVGSCSNMCNGCTNCTASCGTGCASGCNTTCKGGSWASTGVLYGS